MAIVKTTISIEEPLFERANTLARQLHLSRSQLIARALDELLKRHENRRLLDAINSALEGEPDTAEEEHMHQMRKAQRRHDVGQW